MQLKLYHEYVLETCKNNSIVLNLRIEKNMIKSNEALNSFIIYDVKTEKKFLIFDKNLNFAFLTKFKTFFSPKKFSFLAAIKKV